MATLYENGTPSFEVGDDGHLRLAWGDPPTNIADLGDGFKPGAKTSVGRVWPDPNHPYYHLIWVSALMADGKSIRTYRNWRGADHGSWFGPYDAVA